MAFTTHHSLLTTHHSPAGGVGSAYGVSTGGPALDFDSAGLRLANSGSGGIPGLPNMPLQPLKTSNMKRKPNRPIGSPMVIGSPVFFLSSNAHCPQGEVDAALRQTIR